MSDLAWLIVGAVLGAVLVMYARTRWRKDEARMLSIALVVVAAIYVGFAVARGDGVWMVIEIAGVPAYGIFIWLAFRHSFYWLALGWGLHPAWDVLLHLWGPGQAIAPQWYATACVAFDLLVAGYIAARAPALANDRVAG